MQEPSSLRARGPVRELVHLLMSAQLAHLRVVFLCSSLTCAAKGNGKEAHPGCAQGHREVLGDGHAPFAGPLNGFGFGFFLSF